ncbi:hypothetical protein K443DRAFT_628528, partial [Laccaria amethystina LaAM-08-1]
MFLAQITRFWVLWMPAFSATVSTSVVTHSSKCKVSAAGVEFGLRTLCECCELWWASGQISCSCLPFAR